MKLVELKSEFAIVRLSPETSIPSWALESSFYCICKTDEELSIVLEANLVPPGDFVVEKPWKALKVKGPLDFSLTGILASLANPLAENKVSIFAISTFDTDYVLVKSEQFLTGRASLEAVGFEFEIQ